MKALRFLMSGAVALVLAFACGGRAIGIAPAAWASCTVNSDCTLGANSCCGVCGAPPLDDVDAVNKEQLEAHFNAVCPEPLPCRNCGMTNNPNLLSTCSAGACKAVDVRHDSVSECTTDDDCRLRVTGCCECGGSTASGDLIAINILSGDDEYRALVCDENTACPECAPIYPTDVEAYCARDAHCAVRARG